MLNNYNNLKNGNLNEVNNNMLYPLLRWCSGSKKDLKIINEINKKFFWCDKEIMKGLLNLSITDDFVKYPKGIREDNELFNLKKKLIKQYYGWSEQEFNRNINIIDFVDLNKLKDLGLNKKEINNLGLKEVKNESKGLLNFM